MAAADCRRMRYFVAKCASMDSLRRCVASSQWASRERLTPPQPHQVLTQALEEGPVVLIFSVNNNHGWHGYCRVMSTPSSFATARASELDNKIGGGFISHGVQVRATDIGNAVSRNPSDGDSKTSDSKNTDSKIIDSQNTDSKNTDSKSTDTSNSKNTDSKNTDSKNTDSKNTDSQTTNSQTTDSQTTNSQTSDNKNTDSSQAASDVWHYFDVDWSTEFVSSFGEACLPSSSTTHLLLSDGSPLNKARNWQEVSGQEGAEVCSLLAGTYDCLVEKRKQIEEARLAAKPPPFIGMEGEVTEERAAQYWRSIVQKVERELGPVHLACPFGSQRYNVQQPGSDIDAFIVYQAHTKDILGFEPPKMTIKNSDQETCDYTVLELKRYCELLMAQDARCIETLFLQESTIIKASPDWRQLCQHRHHFLTRKCLDKYLGDALGSNGVKKLERLVESSSLGNQQRPPPRLAKLVYIIVRLLQNARDIVKGGPLNVFRPEGSEERTDLLKIRQADITLEEVRRLIERLITEIEGGKDSLPVELPHTQQEVESWLLSLRYRDFQMHPPV